MRALVVDGANVVGSRPDGWWRDRAGAAHRLWRSLAAADLPYDRIVLVLEGAARTGVAAGTEGALLTVHAPASGDEAILEVATALVGEGCDVAVVTADRALQARIEAAAATAVRPSWLLDRL